MGVLTCACGCGTEISPLGLNGKPRRFLQGHQTKNRSTKGTPEYWVLRLRKLNTRAGVCLCGCGEKITVSLEWVQARASKSCVYLPRYLDGHMPKVSCGCGCGTLVPAFDDKYQPRSYVPEHAGKAAAGILKVDWEGRVRDWNAVAPLCACGCGQRLTRNLSQLRSQYKDVKFIVGHNERRACVTELSGVEWSIILGSLLGDLSITRSYPGSTPRLQFTHSMAQVEYARHKTEVLSRLGWDFVSGVPTSGYKKGGLGCRGSSSCMPVFESVWELTRGGGSKRLTQGWLDRLDDRSMAYWYMDDGSVSWSKYNGNLNQISLHTEGFTRMDNESLAAWLGTRGVRGVTVSTTKGYPYLYLPRETAESFLSLVRPYAHSSMSYKFFAAERDHGSSSQSI
jgi:hypothetical protein